jgi:hypothetical protein
MAVCGRLRAEGPQARAGAAFERTVQAAAARTARALLAAAADGPLERIVPGGFLFAGTDAIAKSPSAPSADTGLSQSREAAAAPADLIHRLEAAGREAQPRRLPPVACEHLRAAACLRNGRRPPARPGRPPRPSRWGKPPSTSRSRPWRPPSGLRPSSASAPLGSVPDRGLRPRPRVGRPGGRPAGAGPRAPPGRCPWPVHARHTCHIFHVQMVDRHSSRPRKSNYVA